MQAFLRLLLFFVLLTTGASLKCEVCMSITNVTSKSAVSNCRGPMETCVANKDTCIVAIAEHNLEGKTERIVEKACEFSKICTIDKIHLYVGKGRSYRSSIICCKGPYCPKVPPPLPAENKTPNGKECPACFAQAKRCQPQNVKCTGSDTHCIAVLSTHRVGPNRKEMHNIIRGCTTQALCTSVKQETTPLLMGEINSVLCSPEVSGGSQPTSFLLLTFSGFLLVNIFG